MKFWRRTKSGERIDERIVVVTDQGLAFYVCPLGDRFFQSPAHVHVGEVDALRLHPYRPMFATVHRGTVRIYNWDYSPRFGNGRMVLECVRNLQYRLEVGVHEFLKLDWSQEHEYVLRCAHNGGALALRRRPDSWLNRFRRRWVMEQWT